MVREESCVSILQQHDGQLKCSKATVVFIEQIWFEKNKTCKKSSTSLPNEEKLKIACYQPSRCTVTNNRHYDDYINMNIRFQCKNCLSVHPGSAATITCPVFSLIETYVIRYHTYGCLALITSSRNQLIYRTNCDNSSTCSIQTVWNFWNRANIYYGCKDIARSTASEGDINYAAIAGGIVGGVLLIICTSIGVYFVRRRIFTKSNNKQVMTNLNPTYDPTHVQTEGETNQQGHLMNSPDTLYVSTSHAGNFAGCCSNLQINIGSVDTLKLSSD